MDMILIALMTEHFAQMWYRLRLSHSNYCFPCHVSIYCYLSVGFLFVFFQQPDDDESIRDIKDVIMTDVPDVEIPCVEQIPDSQNSQNEHEISQNYEGAPEMVNEHNITYGSIRISKSIVFNFFLFHCRYKRLKFSLQDELKLLT